MIIKIHITDGVATFANPADAKSEANAVLLADGYVVLEGAIVDATTPAAGQAIQALAESSNPEPLNGSFAAVVLVDGGKRLCLLTDAIGTIPLYYSLSADKREVSISLEPREIVSESGRSTFDNDSVGQLLCFGYVLGENTLIEGVQEVPAATILSLSRSITEDKLRVTTHRYWNFEYEPVISSQQDFTQRAECLAEQFQIRYGNYVRKLGLPCLVKLTSGLDSRLVLAMLLEDTDLVTATYGKPDYYDLIVARSFARQLDIPHHFAPVVGNEAINQDDVNKVMQGLGLRAVPYIGLGSVDVLKACPPKSYSHVPGHTGDFVSGGHIRPLHLDEHDQDGRIGLIRRQHASLDPFLRDSIALPWGLSKWLSSPRSDDLLREHVVETQNQPTWLAIHIWNLRNRQRRFILSDAATLRTNGPVLLPFWDLDILRLFQQTSVDLLRGQSAYKSFTEPYIRRRFGEKLKVDWPSNKPSLFSALGESRATVDYRPTWRVLSCLGKKYLSKVVRRDLQQFNNRYINSVNQSDRLAMCQKAINEDENINAALTQAGKQLVASKKPSRVIEVKQMLDAWRSCQ